MKILHLCLSNYYIDNMGYQENLLVRQNVDDGHDVLVVASTESLTPKNKLVYLNEGEYVGADGARVRRLSYAGFFPSAIKRKVRAYKNLYHEIDNFTPDTILFHGLSSWSLITAAKYCATKRMPLFVDTHTDLNNSARSWLSFWLLHSLFYRAIIARCLPTIRMVLCVSVDSMDFARDVYRIPDSHLEFFPLGGAIPSEAEKKHFRTNIFQEHGLSPQTILMVQSGKFNSKKRIVNTLESFSRVEDPDIRLLLAGELDESIRLEALSLVSADPRVELLGWVTPDELYRILCAADVYLQPGSQSATMQQAICCGCMVVLDNVVSHRPYIDGNGFLINGHEEYSDLLRKIAGREFDLYRMGLRSAEIGADLLDYRKLAARITQSERSINLGADAAKHVERSAN